MNPIQRKIAMNQVSRFRFPASAEIVFCVLACGLFTCKPAEDPLPQSVVPNEVQQYVDTFVLEAKKRNVTIPDLATYGMTIKFGDLSDLFKNLGYNPGGLTTFSTKTITLDSVSWRLNDPLNRETVVLHELGHLFFNRVHDDGSLPNGEVRSLMNSRQYPIFRGLRREYFFDELFSKGFYVPDWAKSDFAPFDLANVKATNQTQIDFNQNSVRQAVLSANSNLRQVMAPSGEWQFVTNEGVQFLYLSDIIKQVSSKPIPLTYSDNYMLSVDCVLYDKGLTISTDPTNRRVKNQINNLQLITATSFDGYIRLAGFAFAKTLTPLLKPSGQVQKIMYIKRGDRMAVYQNGTLLVQYDILEGQPADVFFLGFGMAPNAIFRINSITMATIN